jgi:hypothetical protein
MTFWLLMVIYGTSVSTTHVGNFKSESECANAAKDAQTYAPARTNVFFRGTFICVRANDEGTAPPN